MQIGGWISESWFHRMALQYCGRTYGSEWRNAYFFYRAVYGMTASEAFEQSKHWR